MKYGLIGEHLGHSYSKLIHEQLVDNYEYELHPLAKEQLDAFMKAKAFAAINVTIPYKQDVIPYLDEIDDVAKKINAVNTIVNRGGKLVGYNTDYLGFLYTLKKHGISLQDKKVLVMGNGGASQAIQAVVDSEKAKTMIVVDIVPDDNVISLNEVYEKHLDCEVIINTTPIGMYPNINGVSVDITKFKNCTACIDAIYNPLRTEFVLIAQQLGIKGISGLEMLVAQAKYALELFKDITIDDAEIDRIYRELLLETSNLVLIGMPSCGKSTLGKELSEKLNKKFIDIDNEIVKRIDMSIADYFKAFGEEAFRKIESEVCKEIASENNAVISCGGGIVKNPENIFNLKHNGLIMYVHRDLENLISDHTRPLSSTKEDILKLFEERDCLYRSSRELYVENNKSIELAVKEASEIYKENITILNS
ncbi:shikimate dehydrogenase [Breznakia sp. PF5-3]|uniref:shikimate kinase n=1 Tax=unclassified Breznakia TaxID=2623764 RepID=UPI0024068037|nr:MULTISPECIES: shikimate kinase [unclassified Breznakia]MDL2276789.1 shikimate dehydrogenase [Breznakia sp. OttesenSCG-928-G09]MDF9825273.1 shikimate dehydrogenase [Breznakia sp. PM6-1]MDF9836137.1 shikimate dehydrogenase [Breznakia sp. PF5-3]MDF9838176.1 shikimate dehydrogenase [Breznakia sp. PFB2-8]MDF9860162.1 shikimate dehydrogenase [Breznakia sp. PH5-24]